MGYDYICSLDIDKDDNIYLLGMSSSSNDFPLAGNSNRQFLGWNQNLVLCKMNHDATQLIYSGYININESIQELNIKILADKEKAIVTFSTMTTGLFTTSAFQASLNGQTDIYCAAFNLTSPLPFFATYLGGNDIDLFLDIDTDHKGNVFLVGATNSTDFPTTIGCYDNTYSGTAGGDGYTCKIAYSDCSIINSDIDKIELGNRSCQGDTTVTINLTNDGLYYSRYNRYKFLSWLRYKIKY